MSEPAKSSPLTNALAQVGDRWTLLVVEALLEGPRRFNELAEELDGIAPNILSDRLKRLEKEALLVARPYRKRSSSSSGDSMTNWQVGQYQRVSSGVSQAS